MQRITYRVKASAREVKQRMYAFVTYMLAEQKTTNKVVSVKRFYKTKKIVQISSIALLSLPAKSLTTNNVNLSTTYDHVMLQKSLVLASVPGESTYFATDNFQHGFGYDLARSYASQLGVDIILKSYQTSEDALKAVKSGEADMALTTASTQQTTELDMATLNLSCGQDAKLTENGLHPKVSWSFNHTSDPIAKKASHFLCDNLQVQDTQKLAAFYNQNLLKDAYNQQHFQQAMSERLPNYQSSFQEQANNYNHDWALLVAMGYQESHLHADATSPTGVQGIMMLTNSTAKAMGISDRIDPVQSISGGARYLEKMKAKFDDVPQTDRLWFALAAYNMGPNAIKHIQRELRLAGEDDTSWANVYTYLSDHADTNRRYVQCMHYVSNIRSYLETIKTQTV